MVTMTFRGTTFRVKTRAMLPYLLKKHGITLGSTIRLTGHALSVTPELLAHEFAHVRQWKDMGVLGFLWAYLCQFCMYGYGLKMPLEREAHEFATRYWTEFVPLVGVLRVAP